MPSGKLRSVGYTLANTGLLYVGKQNIDRSFGQQAGCEKTKRPSYRRSNSSGSIFRFSAIFSTSANVGLRLQRSRLLT